VSADLLAAVAELTDLELDAMGRSFCARAQAMLTAGEDRKADVFRAFGCLLLEDLDDRRHLFAALDPDAGIGALVEDWDGE
jgi:hypothetical protein